MEESSLERVLGKALRVLFAGAAGLAVVLILGRGLKPELTEVTAPPNIAVEATGPVTKVNIGKAFAPDGVKATIRHDAPPAFPVGTTRVTWSATDANGNSVTAIQTVTIRDTTPPKLVGLKDRELTARSTAGAKVVYEVTATDTVDGRVPVTCKPASGTVFRLGAVAVACTATDRAGNAGKGKFVVTVRQAQPPKVAKPKVKATGSPPAPPQVAGKPTPPTPRPKPIVPTKTYTDSATGMDFVWVEGGCFQMGHERGRPDAKPLHEVCVDSFFIGKHEVTQAQWERIMKSNPAETKGADHPASSISWVAANEFIGRLNRATGRKYRLPTEAEWEYAARGGKMSQGHHYAGSNKVEEVSWSRNDSGGGHHPVGQKRPNELGIYDLSGNVWEWCSDWYGEDYYAKSPKDNPKGPTNGRARVYRGGSFSAGGWYGSPWTRDKFWVNKPWEACGLRLVMPDPSSP